MTHPDDEPPKVLISYSHDSDEHRTRVRKLADRLRSDEGINCVIDQYHEAPDPKEGWPRWMMDMIEEWADFVLIVTTENYNLRFRGKESKPGVGRGVDWEGVIISNELYDAKSMTIRFTPIVFEAKDREFVPLPLRQRNCYLIDDEFESLVRHIKEEPRFPMPELGDGSRSILNQDKKKAATKEEGAPDLEWFREMLGRYDSPFQQQLEAACEIREKSPNIQLMREPGRPDYFHVSIDNDGIAESFPLFGVEELTEDVWKDILEIDARYRTCDNRVNTTVVVAADTIDDEFRVDAKKRRIRLKTFNEYRGLIDFTRYVAKQTKTLSNDLFYPPALYVEQNIERRRRRKWKTDEHKAVEQAMEWLGAEEGALVLVLAAFGSGKTFLLRQLALRLAEDPTGPIPILIEMRELEKKGTLNGLIASHFSDQDEDVRIAAFRYMLREGRIVLLVDGFDELALRVTYTTAQQRLDTILEAAQGRAKVVLSSRTQHFSSDSQFVEAVDEALLNASGEKVAAVSTHRIARLPKFTEENILAFLTNKLGDADAAQVRLEQLREVKDLLGLSENPRMLSFIAELTPQELDDAKDHAGEVSAASLYRQILTRWLEHEVDRVGDVKAALSVEARWKAVTCLALELWPRAERAIQLEELAESLQSNAVDLKQSHATFDELIHQTGSGTLLIRDESGSFSFVHQSILEWLVAAKAAEELEGEDRPPILERAEVSPLMAEFFVDLAGGRAEMWVKAVLGGSKASKLAQKNAQVIAGRLNVSVSVGADYSAGDLAGADFRSRDLRDATFAGANLMDADFRDANLEGADFSSAMLAGSNFTNAGLDDANFDEANLERARLTHASLARVSFEGANLHLISLALVRNFDDQTIEGKKNDWGAAIAQPVRPQWFPQSAIHATAYHPFLEIVAVGGFGFIYLIDVKSGDCLQTLTGHSSNVTSVSWNRDGSRLASGSDDKSIKVWNPESGDCIHTLTGHSSYVTSVSWNSDGSRLASGSDDKSIKVWNPESGDCLQTLTGHSSYVSRVSWNSDGSRLASGSYDKSIKVWNPESGDCLQTLTGHSSFGSSVSWSSDGSRLASGSYDKSIKVWNPETGDCIHTLTGHSGSVSSVSWNSDGSRLASGSDDKSIKVWNPESGDCLQTLTGHSNNVSSVSWNSDGSRLASGSGDGTIRVWEVATGACLVILLGMSDGSWVAFTEDGRHRLSPNFEKGFWHSMGTVRFEPGELDEFLPDNRKLALPEGWTAW